MNGRRIGGAFAAAVIIAAMIPGCQKPVNFPEVSDAAAATRAGAAGAYDADHDGVIEFFTFADATGRIVRIGYHAGEDGKAARIVDLDAIPISRCRHLVLMLDGFGYDVIAEHYRNGGLRMFHPPSLVITPYPSMTDVCMQDIIGSMACRAIEAKYFDRKTNRLKGGSGDYLSGVNEPYNKVLHYRADLLWDAIGYIDPWAVFGKEANDAKRVFDKAETQDMLAYFVSSAGVSTAMGKEGQLRALKIIERFANQVVYETNGLTKVTLLSDHGHSYTNASRIDIEGFLGGRNWRLTDRLARDRDVVQISFGLVTFASFATNSPSELAADLIECEGVELTSYADGDVVVVRSADGQATIRQKQGRYSYALDSGDPLAIKDILAKLSADSEGYYSPDDLLAATASHEYPAPLERLWRAHFALVLNPPDVIASLANNKFAGLKSFSGSVDIASTHGSLNYSNSAAFIMSTAGRLGPLMRSSDVPGQLKELTGRDFPSGK